MVDEGNAFECPLEHPQVLSKLKIGWPIYQSTHKFKSSKKTLAYIIESPWYNKQGFLSPKHKQRVIMLCDIMIGRSSWGWIPTYTNNNSKTKLLLSFPLFHIYFFFPFFPLRLFVAPFGAIASLLFFEFYLLFFMSHMGTFMYS